MEPVGTKPGGKRRLVIVLALMFTLLNANDGGQVWSNQLIWFVLVPGDHFAFSGPCCGPSPTFSWNVALVNDRNGDPSTGWRYRGGYG